MKFAYARVRVLKFVHARVHILKFKIEVVRQVLFIKNLGDSST
jgi:hypothetical protein